MPVRPRCHRHKLCCVFSRKIRLVGPPIPDSNCKEGGVLKAEKLAQLFLHFTAPRDITPYLVRGHMGNPDGDSNGDGVSMRLRDLAHRLTRLLVYVLQDGYPPLHQSPKLSLSLSLVDQHIPGGTGLARFSASYIQQCSQDSEQEGHPRLSCGNCRSGMPSARITRDVFLGDSIAALGT